MHLIARRPEFVAASEDVHLQIGGDGGPVLGAPSRVLCVRNTHPIVALVFHGVVVPLGPNEKPSVIQHVA